MYSIISDYFDGVLTSCKVNTFASNLYNNSKLFRLVTKIIKYNFLLHMLPTILVQIFLSATGISLYSLLFFLIIPINIFSTLFHILHYMDLVNIVSIHSSKNSSSMQALELISLSLTMTIYQIVIYLTTSFVNIIFHDRLYYIAILLNFVILVIYHSFYCYNNLWQYKKINMAYRIDMHEKLWAFYFGYGTVATIIYNYIGTPIGLGLYNIYMVLVISLPFMVNPKYPSNKNNYPSYPPINLTIFSYITSCIFCISKYLASRVRNSN